MISQFKGISLNMAWYLEKVKQSQTVLFNERNIALYNGN